MASLEVEWASVEVHDLTVHSLHLVLYIHPRTFEYSSNILMVAFDGFDCSLRYFEEFWIVP